MGYFLVTLQFSAIGLLFALGWRGVAENPWLLLPVILGGGLAVHSITTMGIANLRTVPEPAATATLCKKGAYRWIRHPMYLSVLMAALPFGFGSANPLLFAAASLLLVIVLYAKIRIEEKLWMLKDPELFGPYLATTKRLIPFLY